MQDTGTRFPIKWHLMLKYIRNNQKFKKHAEYKQLNYWHIDDIGIISSVKIGKGRRVGGGTYLSATVQVPSFTAYWEYVGRNLVLDVTASTEQPCNICW